MNPFYKLLDSAKRYLFPHKCGGCRQILSKEAYGHAFCSSCFLKWNAAKVEDCPDCFRPAIECTCMPKRLSSAGALCLRKAIFYDPTRRREPCNRLIYFLKHRPVERYAKFLAAELTAGVLRELEVIGIDPGSVTVCGVPRGRRAYAEYGFDQAELIGRALAEELGASYVSAIERKFGGRTQKKLSRDSRLKNVQGRFVLNGKKEIGRTVLLVDDVVTTGASMAECARLLHRAGVRHVLCVCVAQDRKKSKI